MPSDRPTVALLCTANRKQAFPEPAWDLYDSPLFRAAKHYLIHRKPDKIYLMSACHGLIARDEVISPYPETIGALKGKALRHWGERIAAEAHAQVAGGSPKWIILALNRFLSVLTPHFSDPETPLRGFNLGEARNYLLKQNATFELKRK